MEGKDCEMFFCIFSLKYCGCVIVEVLGEEQLQIIWNLCKTLNSVF